QSEGKKPTEQNEIDPAVGEIVDVDEFDFLTLEDAGEGPEREWQEKKKSKTAPQGAALNCDRTHGDTVNADAVEFVFSPAVPGGNEVDDMVAGPLGVHSQAADDDGYAPGVFELTGRREKDVHAGFSMRGAVRMIMPQPKAANRVWVGSLKACVVKRHSPE